MLEDQIQQFSKELSLVKTEIPVFLETYIEDALDTYEKCTEERL